MRHHIPVTPITDIIRHGHVRPIVLHQAVPNISRRHRSSALNHLRQQPAVELQHLTSIRRRPFWKEHHGQTSVHHHLHPPPCLERRAPMSPRHINRPRHRRHPTHHRPALHLRLRDKHTRLQRREHDDIHIAQMVRDDRTLLRKSTGYTDVNPQPMQRSSAESVQPVGPLFPGRRLLHCQLRSRHHKHSRQPNAPPGSPKKIHQIEPSSLNNIALHKRSLSCKKCSPTNQIATPPLRATLLFTTTGSTAA